jgi:CubicO group peptidase (beta-lactamase class C family)
MRLRLSSLFMLLLVSNASAYAAERFPGKSWERIANPSTVGYSRAGLDRAAAIAKSEKTSALMVVVDGRVLLEYGDMSELSYIASVRKSILSMLYGKYVEDGSVRIDRTLADLQINDVGGLMDIERTATIENLLGARSGVFHPASYPGDALAFAPPRGSQKPGTYYLYSNWDFNTLGTIFEQLTHQNIYDALQTDIAGPIEMEDFERSRQTKEGRDEISIHKAYPIVVSTRDMARIGLLMLRDGRWRDRQIVPRVWVRMSTRLVTRHREINPVVWQWGTGRAGYGYLWWVEDRDDPADPLDGAYSARGAFGQFIYVIPKLDMVVAHKVVRCEEGSDRNAVVQWEEFEKILNAILDARSVPAAATRR